MRLALEKGQSNVIKQEQLNENKQDYSILLLFNLSTDKNKWDNLVHSRLIDHKQEQTRQNHSFSFISSMSTNRILSRLFSFKKSQNEQELMNKWDGKTPISFRSVHVYYLVDQTCNYSVFVPRDFLLYPASTCSFCGKL